MSLSVSVVATGNMGAAIGARLVHHGARVVTDGEARSAQSRERAQAAGIVWGTYEDTLGTEIFLSIVPPAEALSLAERFADTIADRRTAPTYVDCNAVSPATAVRIGQTISEAGGSFIDAGIIGHPPAQDGSTTPTIFASGPDAQALKVLNDYGLRIKVTNDVVGSASALKMSYAGITKGLMAIASAMALSADRAGALDALREELRKSQPALAPWLRKALPDMFSKSYRWVAEMDQIAEFVGPSRPGQAAYASFAELYTHLAADFEGEQNDIEILRRFVGETSA